MKKSRITKNFNVICTGFMAISAIVFVVGMLIR